MVDAGDEFRCAALAIIGLALIDVATGGRTVVRILAACSLRVTAPPMIGQTFIDTGASGHPVDV